MGMVRMAGMVERPAPSPAVAAPVPPGIVGAIGGTPLVEVRSVSKGTGARILAKAEFLNPSGSLKDRIARYIVERAEATGRLRPGMRILEVSSGNTGIALAMLGRARGYPVEIWLPRGATRERFDMLERLGARVVALEDLRHMPEAVERARARAAEDPTVFLPEQFTNPDNPACHRATTAREILAQWTGPIDAFVMGVGTGGTLRGVGTALREKHRGLQVVAIEPAESPVLSGGTAGHHGIHGLADGFVPPLYDPAGVDRVVAVPTAEAVRAAEQLALDEGLLVGPSAGANLVAARRVAADLGHGATVVTMLPDRGERYLSECRCRT